ncbi:MAG: DUF2062 domain-containing protein [Gammaproteobacteria bacterium]|nr:DUF2062 domain-containing protein [Gammaproteobacteria bacterium]
MIKRRIKRYIPDKHTLSNHKSLKIFGDLILANNLWHLNRKSVSGAFSVGLFWALIPMPFQMLPAAACALIFRVNLPISMALVWLTNPITMPPVFYVTYQLGAWILNIPPSPFEFELSWDWLSHELDHIWKPFLLGSIISAISAAVLGNILARFGWRMLVIHNWKKRQKKMQSKR